MGVVVYKGKTLVKVVRFHPHSTTRPTNNSRNELNGLEKHWGVNRKRQYE